MQDRRRADLQAISIHAPRAGSDLPEAEGGGGDGYFNPRSPCGERLRERAESGDRVYFNPRSPCGERLLPPRCRLSSMYFNPRSPCGERLPSRRNTPACWYFNPRSPCGERRRSTRRLLTHSLFQSTLPVRGATAIDGVPYDIFVFQSTLPVRGATAALIALIPCFPDFNPRSPCGERLSVNNTCFIVPIISIHAPRAGSDSNIAQISDDRAAILRHGFQTISPPTAEKSLSANKKLFLMPFSAREPPGFFMFTAGSRPAAGQKINVSVTSIEGLAPICFTLPSYAEPIT